MKPPAILAFADRRSQRLYSPLAEKAGVSRVAAIKMFCIECVGYSQVDAKACDNARCPLWQVSNRIFHRTEETVHAATDSLAQAIARISTQG